MKTKFERLLSFNQHRRRRGAANIDQELQNINFKELRESIVGGSDIRYTHGSEKSLNEHIQNLYGEFSGQPELLHYHATLIVLLRREHKPEKQFESFLALWDSEKDFLIKHLNTRWLVSAADTFADFSKNETEQAIALSISLLVNTIKLQETERYLQCCETLQDNHARKKELQEQRVSLFDGTSAFAVGTDDTIRNMRWRMNSVLKKETHCSAILNEIFARLQSENTVYQRFKQKHTRQKTSWW